MNPVTIPAPGLILSLGEAMLELSGREADLWALGVAGDTFNTAWYLRAALPQAWRVGYLSRIGTDPFSDRIADVIGAAGIDTTRIARDPARGCGLYAISLKDGERSFTYWRGQSAARHLADDPAELETALAEAGVIYLSGITLAILPPEGRAHLMAALQARRPGTLLAFDPNIRPRLWPDTATMCAALMAAAAISDLVLPSYDDEAAHFGDASPQETLERYRAAGAREIVVKNGGGDMLAWDGVQALAFASTPITPRDTTGAGDSFNGGYLAARLQGARIEAALRSGADLARIVIMHPGALVPREVLAQA